MRKSPKRKWTSGTTSAGWFRTLAGPATSPARRSTSKCHSTGIPSSSKSVRSSSRYPLPGPWSGDGRSSFRSKFPKGKVGTSGRKPTAPSRKSSSTSPASAGNHRPDSPLFVLARREDRDPGVQPGNVGVDRTRRSEGTDGGPSKLEADCRLEA